MKQKDVVFDISGSPRVPAAGKRKAKSNRMGKKPLVAAGNGACMVLADLDAQSERELGLQIQAAVALGDFSEAARLITVLENKVLGCTQ